MALKNFSVEKCLTVGQLYFASNYCGIAVIPILSLYCYAYCNTFVLNCCVWYCNTFGRDVDPLDQESSQEQNAQGLGDVHSTTGRPPVGCTVQGQSP